MARFPAMKRRLKYYMEGDDVYAVFDIPPSEYSSRNNSGINRKNTT